MRRGWWRRARRWLAVRWWSWWWSAPERWWGRRRWGWWGAPEFAPSGAFAGGSNRRSALGRPRCSEHWHWRDTAERKCFCSGPVCTTAAEDEFVLSGEGGRLLLEKRCQMEIGLLLIQVCSEESTVVACWEALWLPAVVVAVKTPQATSTTDTTSSSSVLLRWPPLLIFAKRAKMFSGFLGDLQLKGFFFFSTGEIEQNKRRKKRGKKVKHKYWMKWELVFS